jgi:hypothetical protein
MEKRIGNYLIKTEQCEAHESPREWDNLGSMVCFHKRYNLGDKTDYKSSDYGSWDELRQAIIKNEDVCAILPLRLYDHSGITISTTTEYPYSDRWDAGQIGFIYVSKAKVRKEFSVKRISKKLVEDITKQLVGEVKTYDQYLTGDVYEYSIYKVETCNLGCDHEELVDSCGGYYGEDEAITEAESLVSRYIKQSLEVTI